MSEFTDIRNGYALNFLDEVAAAAGGAEILDFGWGFGLGLALENGWRVLPPTLQIAADTVLQEFVDEREAS